MSFESFQKKVKNLIRKSGWDFFVDFSSEDGRYYARISDGTMIIGNSDRLKVTVKWGTGHTAMAVL